MSAARQLTPADRLRQLEAVVARGLRFAVEAGEALRQIRAERLYEAAGFGDFDSYLLSKTAWRFGRSRAYQLITLAEVTEDVSTSGGHGGPLPNERQARELAPLEPEGRLRVWQEATAEGQPAPTAARVRELVGKALASLPPEEQAEVLAANNASVAGEMARQVGGEQRKERLEAVERLGRRLHKLIAGLGDEAEVALSHLDACLAAVRALP